MDTLMLVLYGLAGLATFAVVCKFVEFLGHKLVPAPPAARSVFEDRALMKRAYKGDAEAKQQMVTAMLATGAGPKVMVLLAWIIGAGAGSFVAGTLAGAHEVTYGCIIAGFNAMGVFMMGRMLPHPLWMTVMGYVLPFLTALLVACGQAGGCFL